MSAKTVMDSDFELHVGLRHIWVEARHHAAMDRVPFRWGDEHGSWEEPCCEVYAKYTDVSGAHKKARDAGMHLGILKVLDTFRAPFGFGKGFEAAGRVALFIAILSLGFIVVALGLCCLGTHVSVEVFLVSTLAVCVHNSLSTFAVRKRCSDCMDPHVPDSSILSHVRTLCRCFVLCHTGSPISLGIAYLVSDDAAGMARGGGRASAGDGTWHEFLDYAIFLRLLHCCRRVGSLLWHVQAPGLRVLCGLCVVCTHAA